jgi:hypothetical protein
MPTPAMVRCCQTCMLGSTCAVQLDRAGLCGTRAARLVFLFILLSEHRLPEHCVPSSSLCCGGGWGRRVWGHLFHACDVVYEDTAQHASSRNDLDLCTCSWAPAWKGGPPEGPIVAAVCIPRVAVRLPYINILVLV